MKVNYNLIKALILFSLIPATAMAAPSGLGVDLNPPSGHTKQVQYSNGSVTINHNGLKIVVQGSDRDSVYCEAQDIASKLVGEVSMEVPAGTYSCPMFNSLYGTTGLTVTPSFNRTVVNPVNTMPSPEHK